MAFLSSNPSIECCCNADHESRTVHPLKFANVSKRTRKSDVFGSFSPYKYGNASKKFKIEYNTLLSSFCIKLAVHVPIDESNIVSKLRVDSTRDLEITRHWSFCHFFHFLCKTEKKVSRDLLRSKFFASILFCHMTTLTKFLFISLSRTIVTVLLVLAHFKHCICNLKLSFIKDDVMHTRFSEKELSNILAAFLGVTSQCLLKKDWPSH